MYLQFIIILSGCLVAFRISQFILRNNLLPEEKIGKIAFIAFVFNIFLLITKNLSLIFLLFAVFAQNLSLFLLVVLHNLQLERRWRQNFPHILDQIIMKMRCGDSFAAAFRHVSANSEAFMQQKLNLIWDNVSFSQQKSNAQLSEHDLQIYERFKLIHQRTHSALKNLLLWRKEIKLQQEFRRRSGQIVYQMRLQSLVMTLLHLILSVAVLKFYPFEQIKNLFMISAVLFLLGLIWIFISGRRLRCNI